MPFLPLESFRRILGYHPFHFWGLAGSEAPVLSACNSLVMQYGWQGTDAAGRADIATAIATAETRLREHLGYSVAPHYVAETLPYRGGWLQLSEGHVQMGGVEQLTLLGTATVTYSDADGDGIKERWSASIATTITDAGQIAVAFIAADADERTFVAPVKVTIAGGNATITGKAWQLVPPRLYEGIQREDGLDATATSSYAASVAVWQRTTDTVNPATLLWDGGGCCSDGVCSTTSTATCIGIRDGERGLIAVDTGYQCRPPDRVTVRYLAGYPLVNNEMAQSWQVVVARLAMAELSRVICACENANHELHRWQFDLSRSAGVNDEQYQISQGDLDNPLGTRAGQVYAWKALRTLRQLRGVTAG